MKTSIHITFTVLFFLLIQEFSDKYYSQKINNKVEECNLFLKKNDLTRKIKKIISNYKMMENLEKENKEVNKAFHDIFCLYIMKR